MEKNSLSSLFLSYCKRILHVIEEYVFIEREDSSKMCYLLRFFFPTTAMIVRLFVQADFPEHDCHDESTDWFDVNGIIVEAILFYKGFFFSRNILQTVYKSSIHIPLLRLSFNMFCAVILEFYPFELEIHFLKK